jgi:DNA-binding protein H-NS
MTTTELISAKLNIEKEILRRVTNGGLAAHALKGRKLPIRFRNPKNPRETWAGRGLRPRWLTAALKGRGKKLSDFAVR